MPTGHDSQFVCEATLHLPLGPSLIKSSSFSPFARLLIAPSDTHQRSFHHTNSAGRAQIAHKHGPATGPHEWRWPNKPRPHIIRSDSLLLRERPGLSRRPFVLTCLQFSEWLSPLPHGSWAAAGKSRVYDDLVGTASCCFCPRVAVILDWVTKLKWRHGDVSSISETFVLLIYKYSCAEASQPCSGWYSVHLFHELVFLRSSATVWIPKGMEKINLL